MILWTLFLFMVITFCEHITPTVSEDFDGHGYIVYCPCMGRFGNQAEQLLGSLQFAKSLNRTLVLPPFIDYQKNGDIDLIPFEKVVNVTNVNEFHRVMLLNDFMTTVAPVIWMPDQRSIFCYSSRPGPVNGDCNPCEGNPFETFWKHLNITKFKSSVIYKPLMTNYLQADKWIDKYSKYQVITFVGAPSAFPVNSEATKLQEYIQFSNEIVAKAEEHKTLRGMSPDEKFIGVHLRWASDWERVCKLLTEHELKTLFSSSQCSSGDQVLPLKLCLHDIDLIVSNIHKVLSENPDISSVYIASDKDDLKSWPVIFEKLKKFKPDLKLITPTSVFSSNGERTFEKSDFLTDLYLLSESEVFLGNCISSFSAFVSRMRAKDGLVNKFLGQEELNHDEL